MSVRWEMYFVCDVCGTDEQVAETDRTGGVAFVEPPPGWRDEMAVEGASLKRLSTCPACLAREREHASHFRYD